MLENKEIKLKDLESILRCEAAFFNHLILVLSLQSLKSQDYDKNYLPR